MTLGPTPEFCLHAPKSLRRTAGSKSIDLEPVLHF
jgi:hypothetical protein